MNPVLGPLQQPRAHQTLFDVDEGTAATTT